MRSFIVRWVDPGQISVKADNGVVLVGAPDEVLAHLKSMPPRHPISLSNAPSQDAVKWH